METITSTTNTYDQNCIIIPSEVGIGGILRITGDPGVMNDMYSQARANQRQALLEAPQRVLGAVTGFLGNVASNVALEAKMAAFDAIHQTNYRQIRHDLVEQRRRERFEQSIGLMAVNKR